MAENKKKPGKRAYLNDFVQNERGEYVYQGRLVYFNGTDAEYKKLMHLAVAAGVLIVLFTLVPELLPSVPASRFPVSAVLWLVQMVSALLMIYSVWKMFWAGNPIREYRFKKSVQRLPGQTIVCAAASLALGAEQIIYLIIKGIEGNVFFNIIRPVAALICAAAAYQFHLMIKRAEWNA